MLDALERAAREVADFVEIPFGDSFDVPPARALAYFRSKGLKVTFSYRDLVGDAHDQAFTVAKMLDIDLLRSVRDRLGDALASGQSFGDWKKTIMPELKAAGWWGEPNQGARRLDTIFRTNMQTAYSAEQWEQMREQAELAPYLLYDAVDDNRTRALHKLWDNTVLPFNDPWWKTHYPPNGYNCRCSVLQLSAAELDAMGIPVNANAPDQGTYILDGRRVPLGLDPGFDRNVGESLESGLNNALQQKLQTLPDALRSRVESSMVAQKEVFDRRVRGGLLTPTAKPTPAKGVPGDTLTKWTDADGYLKPARAKLHDKIVQKFVGSGKSKMVATWIDSNGEPKEYESFHKTPALAEAMARRIRGQFTRGPKGDAGRNSFAFTVEGGRERSANPTVTFLGGGSAAGKSNILSSLPKTGFTLDVDDVRKELPEYQADTKAGGERGKAAAARTHEESSLLTKRIGATAAERGLDITIDGTGDGSIESLSAKIAGYRTAGHKIEAHYVTSSIEEAIARAETRGQRTGRYVPEDQIRGLHRAVSVVFPQAVERGLFDKFSVWDTTGSTRENKAAKLIASGEGRKLVIHDRAAWARFLAKGRA